MLSLKGADCNTFLTLLYSWDTKLSRYSYTSMIKGKKKSVSSAGICLLITCCLHLLHPSSTEEMNAGASQVSETHTFKHMYTVQLLCRVIRWLLFVPSFETWSVSKQNLNVTQLAPRSLCEIAAFQCIFLQSNIVAIKVYIALQTGTKGIVKDQKNSAETQ